MAMIPSLNAAPAEIFVAPNGSPSGKGTRERPLDLATALSGKSSLIRPGDTVWLLGGTYRGSFTSNLTGTSTASITVRQMAGERAIIDGSGSTNPTLTVHGAWTVYWGFEITNSSPDRVNTRPNGVMIFGPHTRFINLTVHETGVGMGFWSPALDAEIYGCVIYRNGWQGPPPDRGHGHGIYAQNEVGTKRIADNIIFDQYGYGIHVYAQEGNLKGFLIEGNIIFNNGSLASTSDLNYPNILVGGYKPAERISLISNYTYHPWNKIATNVQLNYTAQNNKDLTLQDNYLAGGKPMILTEWSGVTATNNTLAGPGGLLVVKLAASPSAYEWDHNTYFTNNSLSASPFTFETQQRSASHSFTDWQQVSGFDRNSQLHRSETSKPSGLKVFIRPNLYETGRANIGVYNWEGNPTVDVDLGKALNVGTHYELLNVSDYFGRPVASGAFDGKSIKVPMSGTKTGPEFNAFVLIQRESAKYAK